LNNILNFIKKIWTHSLGVRFLISGFIGILTGSTLFGRISEYAIYFYTMSYGGRPPVEGIGVLRPTIVFFSFCLSLIAFIIFYGGIYLLKKVLQTVNRYFNTTIWLFRELSKTKLFKNSYKESEITKLESFKDLVPDKKLSRFCTWLNVFALIIYPILYLVFLRIFIIDSNLSVIDYFFTKQGIDIALPVLLFVPLILTGLSLFLKPNFLSISSMLLTFTIVISLISFSVEKDNYMSFLRKTKYGGGILVSVEINCNDNINCKSQFDSNLLLRTSEALMFYDLNTKEIFEIPLKQVMSIRYKNTKEFNLPKLKHD
jgi:hypothetical protein